MSQSEQHNRRSWTRQQKLIAALVALALLAVGAVVATRFFGGRQLQASGPTATVERRGFAVTYGGVIASANGGVAPIGVEVVLGPAPDLIAAAGIEVEAESPPMQIGFDNGQQPTTPVTVSWQIPSDRLADPTPIAFITQLEDGTWEGLPVTVQDGVAYVTLTHFSFFQFLRPSNIINGVTNFFNAVGEGVAGLITDAREYLAGLNISARITDAILSILGQSFTAPSCVGQEVTLNGRLWTATTNAEGLWACAEIRNRRPVATIYANSAFPWEFNANPPSSFGLPPIIPSGNISAQITAAAFPLMHPQAFDRRTLLISGWSASVELAPGVVADQFAVVPSASMSLVPILINAVDMAVKMTTSTTLGAALSGAGTVHNTANCISRTVSGNNFAADGAAVIGCVSGAVVRSILAIPLAIVTSLLAQFISLAQGLITTITSGPLTVTLSSVDLIGGLEEIVQRWIRTGDNGGVLYEMGGASFGGWLQYGADWGEGPELAGPAGRPAPHFPGLWLVLDDWSWLPEVDCRSWDRDWGTGTWQDDIVLCEVATGSWHYAVDEWDVGSQRSVTTITPQQTGPIIYEFILGEDGNWIWLPWHN